MARFQYKAARSNGTTLEAIVEGMDERTVRGQLERDGLIVLSVQADKVTKISRRNWLSGRISLHEFLVFNQELLAMLKAGLPTLQLWTC